MRRHCILALWLTACVGGPTQGASSETESDTGDYACPVGGRRLAFAWQDELGQGRLRVFVDLDGDGLALTPGEAFEHLAPAGESLRGVGWLDVETVLLVGESRVFAGALSEDFTQVQWTALAELPGAEAGNAFLAGFYSPGPEHPGEAWGLFDLPWTPQLVRLDGQGLELVETLAPGDLGDGERSLARMEGRWLVADPGGKAVWDLGEDFSAPTKFVDSASAAWAAAGLSDRPHTLSVLRDGLVAIQDDGDSAFIYLAEDLDDDGSIDPQVEVSLFVEPGICHRPRPRHLANLGERLLWVDDCEGTIIQEQPGEAAEQRYFTLPAMALIHPDARSVGISAWNQNCVES